MVKVVLATGGTGGHIFPAQALRDRLAEQNHEIVMIVDKRYLKYVKNNSDKSYILAVDNISKSGICYKLMAICKLSLSFFQAFGILIKQKPQIVIGFGGYPSFPTIFAAYLLNIPTIIHEQNAVLGRANRFLSRYVNNIATSFPIVKFLEKKYLNKVKYVGNPVRSEIAKISQKYIPVKEGGFIDILVIGGSQGAKILSEIVPAALSILPQELRSRIRITQQAREENLQETIIKYQKLGIEAKIASFFENIDQELQNASLVISRSGASSVFELIAATRPAILIPYPHAMDEHQLYNAKYYSEIGAGIVIEEVNLTPELLAHQLETMITNPEILSNYAANAKSNYINSLDNFMSLIKTIID